MKAKVIDYTYQKSSSGLQQGCRSGYRPRNAVAGGNGSFIVVTPPKITLTLEAPNGKHFSIDISEDIADYIHNYVGKKVTEKQVRLACDPMIGAIVEVTDDRDGILHIGRYLPD